MVAAHRLTTETNLFFRTELIVSWNIKTIIVGTYIEMWVIKKKKYNLKINYKYKMYQNKIKSDTYVTNKS